MSVAGLVFAVLAIVLFWLPLFGWLGVLFGMVALALGGLVVRKNVYRGRGLVAVVLGGLAVALGLQIQLGGGGAQMGEAAQMEQTFDELEAQLDDTDFAADLAKQLEAIEDEAPSLEEEDASSTD